eukprot:TRINITY_DN196_c0_g1_i3.p2 TRINITY_DN196_c0_g1~~TRINITY_DN196_c0_g1_i3.p2  ORF type:complete len:120 (-),score=8.37 TRINITY_DN196_c0_g1_i3:6-365(-)
MGAVARGDAGGAGGAVGAGGAAGQMRLQGKTGPQGQEGPQASGWLEVLWWQPLAGMALVMYHHHILTEPLEVVGVAEHVRVPSSCCCSCCASLLEPGLPAVAGAGWPCPKHCEITYDTV